MKTIKDLKQMISEPASKEWFEKHGGAKKAIAKKMGGVIPGVTASHEKKVLKSIKKTGRYESPASKKAQKESDKKWSAYTAERSERYKRDGITE